MKNYFLVSALFIGFFLINSCEEKKSKPDPVAAFTVDQNNVLVPATIIFYNESTDATSYNWDFGDGSASSTLENPSHEYTSSGTFPVTLTATGDGGTDAITQTVTILPSLTGKWDKTFYINGIEFNGTMNITHNENGKLTGDFVFSDGTGYTQLLSSSEISGTSVTIAWVLDDPDNIYNCQFQGTVNSSYINMSGNWYLNGSYVSNWSATKTSMAKSVINYSNSTNSQKDRLLQLLNE